MARGRKPASLIAGTSPVSDVPKAPAWLSKDAKAEWRRVAPILVERNVLTEADLGTLESYCVATARVRELERIIARDGLIVVTPQGPKRHPAIGAQNASITSAKQLGAELGLTPVSRSRPVMKESDSEELAFLG